MVVRNRIFKSAIATPKFKSNNGVVSYVFYTFHFHDSIVRNILCLLFLLCFNPGLIVLVRGYYNYGLSNHAFKWAHFTLLSVRVYVGLFDHIYRSCSDKVSFGSKNLRAIHAMERSSKNWERFVGKKYFQWLFLFRKQFFWRIQNIRYWYKWFYVIMKNDYYLNHSCSSLDK